MIQMRAHTEGATKISRSLTNWPVCLVLCEFIDGEELQPIGLADCYEFVKDRVAAHDPDLVITKVSFIAKPQSSEPGVYMVHTNRTEYRTQVLKETG